MYLLSAVLVVLVQNVVCQISSAIPSVIQQCYWTNYTMEVAPPSTLSLLIELLRKVEINSGNVLSMRALTSAMIHGVVFDGIRRSSIATEDNDFVIPYRASGEQFYKYKVLVDYLIPGQIALFPVDSLSTPELCFLHTLLSNTIDPFERGDESSTCEDRSYMPLVQGNTRRLSSCPTRKGVIKTTWGTLSANQLVMGIVAGLEDNKVTFGRVVGVMEKEKDTVNISGFATSNNEVNTVWVATFAGDLAGALLNQTSGKLIIGNEGYWNDTLLPRVFYLNSLTWDMTESDILGSIDGAILGTHIKSWTNIRSSLRLSQVLDMFYSERGITFDSQLKAGNRSSFLQLLNNDNLTQQIIGSAKLLRTVGHYTVSLSETAVNTLAKEVDQYFKIYAGEKVKNYDTVEYVGGRQGKTPLDLIVILDGSFDYYTSHQMIYTLAETIQVSYYGSQLGIINGQSGNWISNVTRSIFQILVDLKRSEEGWPVTLSLGKSLESIVWHYQNRTVTDCSPKLKPLSKAIVVFSKDGRLTDNDMRSSGNLLNTIKSSYPDTRIVYVTQSENNAMWQLLLDENDSVMEVSGDMLALVSQLAEKLNKLPMNIIKIFCNQSELVFEDFVTPQIESLYEIHWRYLNRRSVNVKFINSDYGDLYVCAFTSISTASRACKDLTVNGEISFDSRDFCTTQPTCNLQFEIAVNGTRTKCTEYDCKYPDQVRLNIKSTYRSKGALPLFNMFIIVFCIFWSINL